jgi:hypothetical protein
VFSQNRPVIAYGGFTDTWNKVTYAPLEESKRQYYTAIIKREISKYPDEYYAVTKLKTIVLVKNLKFDNVFRASVPDNYKSVLYMGIKDEYSDDYFIHCIHHEQNHFAEFAIWGDYRYRWDQWTQLFNGPGGGGELAYQAGGEGYTMTYRSNLPGFLNTYSGLGQEEDRSEMVGYFLTDSENQLFMAKAKRDVVFHRKAILLFSLYAVRLNFPRLMEQYIGQYSQ